MKKLYTLALMILLSSVTMAQQKAMFTQYMFNGLAINPAYAGSKEQATASVMVRDQWVGLEGAPSSKTLTLHSPVMNKNIGLGLMFINDRIGVTEQNGLYASYAYRILIDKDTKISMGLQAGLTNYSVDFNSIGTDDPTFNAGSISEMHPNVGVGVYYHDKRFFAGLSVPQLIENTFDQNNDVSESKLVRHYFFTSGYVFDVAYGVKLKPSVLLKYVEGTPMGLDLNTNVILHDLLWVGGSIRNFNSFVALLQVQASDRLKVGYAYDFANTSSLGRVNTGSHEINVSYTFHTKHKLVTTPRFF